MMTTRCIDDDVYRLMTAMEILLLDKKTEVSFENCKKTRSGVKMRHLELQGLLLSDRGVSLRRGVKLEACRKDLGEYKDSKLRK